MSTPEQEKRTSIEGGALPPAQSSSVDRGILLLARRELEQLLSLEECIAAVEEAFRAHAEGRAIPPGVLGAHVEGGRFHIKAAGLLGSRPYYAAKLNGNFYHNEERFGLPRIQGLIVLCDACNGSPLAVMDSGYITLIRTAAATAVAAKYLARRDAETITICGGGVTDAVDTGHEDHAGRRDPGNVLCVMTRSTGHGFEGEPEVVRLVGDEGAQAGIGGYRGCGPIEFLELDARTSIVRDHLCFRRDPLEKSLDLVGRQVPQFETHDDFSRDHIRSSRLSLDLSHCTHLTSRLAGDNTMDRQSHFGCCQHRIPAFVHGGRSGVIRGARYHDVPPSDTEDALHDADVDLLVMEYGALFDMEFDECGEISRVPSGRVHSFRIASDCPQPLGNGLSTVTHEL